MAKENKSGGKKNGDPGRKMPRTPDNLPEKFSLQPLEKQVFTKLVQNKLHRKSILVAVSGGVDSMALLHALWRISKKSGVRVGAAIVHHGRNGSSAQNRFRQRSVRFVEKYCEKRKIFFVTNNAEGHKELEKVEPSRESESSLRKIRYHHLDTFKNESKFDLIALAHHRDDLMETRLLRLIRGVGSEGLVAMSFINNIWLRPFLSVGREEVVSYAEKMSIDWLEDPSNKKPEALRNWLRLKWLPELERKRPGSLKSLSRSLENLVTSLDAKRIECSEKQDVGTEEVLKESRGDLEQSIVRKDWVKFSAGQKESAVARIYRAFLRCGQITGYSAGQIGEVVKRLSANKKKDSFKVAEVFWSVDTEHILARPDLV